MRTPGAAVAAVTTLRFGRRVVEVTNEGKPMFPDDGITKGDVVAYYRAVAPAMLVHLRRRPLVMQRFPDGIAKGGFYHKDAPSYFPVWIRRVAAGKEGGGSVDHVVCDDVATLVYVANQGALTLHTWLSRADDLDRPDQLVIDLDPPEGGFAAAVRAAIQARALLDEIGLVPFVKTTGGKGLHVAAPLDRSAPFSEARRFGRDVAAVLSRRDPDRLTTEVRKSARGNRLFLDSGRTAYGQHAVAPYSLRPRPGAPVATPLAWEELDDSLDPSSLTLEAVSARVEDGVDPWDGMMRRARSLRGPRTKLDRLLGAGD